LPWLAAWGGASEALKTILLIAASGVTVGGLYAGGAFDRGEVYDLPAAEVRQRLEAVRIPQMAAATATGRDTELRPVTNGDRVEWRLNGKAGAVFSAILASEGPHRTRVRLDYEPASVDDSFGDRLRSTRFLRGFAETSFAEEVDARLEGRVADQAQAMRDFARQVAEDPEAVRELGLVTQDMFKSVSAQLDETMRAERAEPNARARMDAATKPMIQLPVN
jgi:hypothetical protein